MKVVKVRFLYSTVRSASLKDVLVKGAGIGAVIVLYTFEKFGRHSVEIAKIKLAYTTVRFASLRNAPARGAKIGAVIGFYTF